MKILVSSCNRKDEMHIKISMAPMYLKFYLMVNEAADDSLLMSCFYFEIYEFEIKSE